MAIAEIKERIHEQIESLSDMNVLSIIDDLLTQNYQPAGDIPLSDEQKIALEKSETDFLAGRFISREKAALQVSDWLKKNP